MPGGRPRIPRPWPLQPLLDATGLTVEQLGTRVAANTNTLAGYLDTGITDVCADRWAIRCGLHPSEVWPDWADERKAVPV